MSYPYDPNSSFNQYSTPSVPPCQSASGIDSYSPPQPQYGVGPHAEVPFGVGSPYPSGVASSSYPTSSAPYPPTPVGSTGYSAPPPGYYGMPQPYPVSPHDVSAPSASYTNHPPYGWSVPGTNTGPSYPPNPGYGPGAPPYSQNYGYGSPMQQGAYPGYGLYGKKYKHRRRSSSSSSSDDEYYRRHRGGYSSQMKMLKTPMKYLRKFGL